MFEVIDNTELCGMGRNFSPILNEENRDRDTLTKQ